MQVSLAYKGHSAVRSGPDGLAVALAPNLRRDRVAYVGTLASPLRFREAVSALHEVVVSDLKYKPKDRTAYRQYLAEQQRQEQALRTHVYRQAYKDEAERQPEPMPVGLKDRF